ncbi:MAG TPA: 7-carboxy-7-deazaguanine synthase QueE [Chloroflexota bacterium]
MSARIASDPNGVGVSTRTLVVSEIFGPTFQGEGASIGQRVVFLRLGGCNLHCRWCDTPYTWDWTGRNGTRYEPSRELHRMDGSTVWESLRKLGSETLVVSGGEPLLQQRALVPLLKLVSEARWWIEVETAGTIAPHTDAVSLVSRFNVSPKLGHSDNLLAERYRPEVLDAFQRSGKAVWKFVAEGVSDLGDIGELVSRHSLRPVYVMPLGTEPDAINTRTRALAAAVIARGWNLTTRLHILLYGNRRGV